MCEVSYMSVMAVELLRLLKKRNHLSKSKSTNRYPATGNLLLELTSPNLSQGFEKLVAQGATQISIVPVLLLSLWALL